MEKYFSPPDLPPPTDEITPAVLRFLQAVNEQDSNATRAELTKLVRICLCFCRNLCPWNGFEGVDEPQWGELQREEGRREIVTDWIQERLLIKLEKYYYLSRQEIEAAGARGDFRWLGVHFRQAILKEIRKRRPKDRLFVCVAQSLSADDSIDGRPLSDLLVAAIPNIYPDRDPGASKISIDDIRNELDRLGLWDVFEEIVRGREIGLTMGDITRRVAELRGISDRQARNKITACRKAAQLLASG
jgi:hypothetical protein